MLTIDPKPVNILWKTNLAPIGFMPRMEATSEKVHCFQMTNRKENASS